MASIVLGNQSNFDGSTLQTGQNTLFNAHSLRTFASLTTKNGGSYIRVFTVLISYSYHVKGIVYSQPSCAFLISTSVIDMKSFLA